MTPFTHEYVIAVLLTPPTLKKIVNINLILQESFEFMESARLEACIPKSSKSQEKGRIFVEAK